MTKVLPSGVLRSVKDCGVAKWKFLAPKEVKGFMVHYHVYWIPIYNIFRFSELFFGCLVSKNFLTLFQNLATVMRQIQSTLMAKPANFLRLDNT